MKNKVFLISMAVFFQAASISSAFVINQAQDMVGKGPAETVGIGINQNLWSWQEFKPTMNNLEQVGLYLGTYDLPEGIIVSFEIRMYLTSTLTWEQVEANSDIIWWGTEGDPYPRGIASKVSEPPFDFGFRTWAVTEPTTLLMLDLDTVMVRRRRQLILWAVAN